jgi:hypothetical protein
MNNNKSYPKRSRQAITDLLDIEQYYTHTLDENLGCNGVNLKAIKRGVKAYKRSAFDIRGLIALDCNESQGPSSVCIKVGLKGRRFHMLQSAIGSAPIDTLVGVLKINYSGGQNRKINMLYGRNIRNMVDSDQHPLTDAKVIILDRNAEGAEVQLSRYAALNPLPELEVESIEISAVCPECRPIIVGITLERLDPVYEWFDEIKVGLYNPIMKRSLDATPDMIDLTDYYHASLDDDWFNHSSHDLHDVPKGVQCLGETYFDVRGLICIAGVHSLEITGLALPEEIRGIRVNRKGKGIHFLHACAFSCPRGTQIGEYVIKYEDGSSVSTPIVYGVNVIDWWESDIVSEARIAWIGSHASARAHDKQTRLIKYEWVNPHPELEMISFDYVSSLAVPAPFLFAVTVIPE